MATKPYEITGWFVDCHRRQACGFGPKSKPWTLTIEGFSGLIKLVLITRTAPLPRT